MASLINNFGLLANQNHFSAYFIFYIATIFAGSVAEFTGFWLVFKGFLGPWGLLFFPLVVFASSTTGDLMWYYFGRALRETRFGNFVKNRLPGHAKIEERIHKNGINLVFATRFIYASAFPLIFSIGWAGVRFKKFFRMSIVSSLVWVPVLTGIAYVLTLSLAPLQSVAIFKDFEIVFLIGIVTFFILNYLVTRFIKYLIGHFKIAPED